jgi:hypothetical protein
MQLAQLLFVDRLGACVSRHWARWVSGKAITSRIDFRHHIIVTMRSSPKTDRCGRRVIATRQQEAKLLLRIFHRS